MVDYSFSVLGATAPRYHLHVGRYLHCTCILYRYLSTCSIHVAEMIAD